MLIGIIGKIGVGKSTVTSYLKYHGYKEYAIASPIKNIGSILGFTESQLNGTQLQKMEINNIWNISGREFCQKFGTDICRDSLPLVLPSMKNIWVKLLEENIKNKDNVVVSDVRFLDEAAIIKKNKGILIKITKDDVCENIKSNHKSEHNDIIADYIIENNGTVDELFVKIDQIIKSI